MTTNTNPPLASAAATAPNIYTVSGTISTDAGIVLAGAHVSAYDQRISVAATNPAGGPAGGNVLLGNGVTDASGNYSIQFTQETLKGKAKPDIQLSVFDPGNEKVQIGSSAVVYNAGTVTTLNVTVPAAKVTRVSEYERLLADMAPALQNIPMRELKADTTVDHITYLANKSGWDARLVAMAAQADKMSAQTKIPAAHFYALYRSGVAGDATSFNQLSSGYIEDVLTRSATAKIIPAGTDIGATVKLQQAQQVSYVLQNPVGGALSNLGSMLDLRLNTDQKQIFVQTYTQAGADMTGFWQSLSQKGFSADLISRLQTDGKLGYLTLQNAPLVKRLHDGLQLQDVSQLVHAGYYKPDAWKKVIGSDIPTGLNADEYATGLANQVAISYPTLVTAEMINAEEIKLGDASAKQEVYQFFTTNSPKFIIGQHPVKTWDNFSKLGAASQASAKKLERLYQLSPSNDAMSALSSLPLGSAYDITRYSREEFVSQYGKSFPDAGDADSIYTKAHEIHSTVLNMATNYIGYRTTPNIYGVTGKTEKTMADVIAYPTLEELFGNMDYCSCDECKSVLGAAAYLVDLLQFIDLTGKTFDKQNPIDVLFTRRPDIQHLQLTCENTNIPVPYIDLVNEILEFYIVNGNINGFTGHDMTPATDPVQLLADPQFVLDAAYDKVKQEVYPYILPFDQALEALRLLFQVWDVTLEDALGIFKDALSARLERIKLNKQEYSTLSDINFHKLPEYFGQPAAATIDALNTAIAAGKAFCQTTDILYQDLVTILETGFINPGIAVVPLLQQLPVGLDKIEGLYNGTLTDDAFNALLPGDFDKTDFGGNVPQWLRTNKDAISGLITLTDIDPGTNACDFAKVELRYALPTDLTQNKLAAISYHKLHRFIRLWKKEGWSIGTLDSILVTLSPTPSIGLTEANIDAVFVTLLARIANFRRLMDHLSVTEKKFPAWLSLWDTTVDVAIRQVNLAKLFKMRVEDLLDLSAITGIDPLAMDMETDNPSLPRFVTILEDNKQVPLKVSDLNYILRHKDVSGKLTPSDTDLGKNIKALRDAMAGIDADLSKAPDNADLTFAKGKMALVYDTTVVDDFFALLSNSTTYSVPLPMQENFLPQKLTTADANIGYDPFKKQLTYMGVMTNAAKTALDAAVDSLVLADMTVITVQGDLDTLKGNLKTAFQGLQDAGNADLNALGASYPELLPVYNTAKAVADPSQQLTTLLNSLLPALKTELKANALRQGLSGMLNSDPDIVYSLTADPAVLYAVSDNTKIVLNDFTQLEAAITFDSNSSYVFYLDFPATDDYLVYVDAPQNTKVSLTVDGVLAINGVTVGASGEVENAAPLSQKAGRLALVQLDISSLPAGKTTSLYWQTKGMAKAPVPPAKLYAKASVDNAKKAFIRLQKATQLQSLLNLTPVELAYFAALNSETQHLLNDLHPDNSITDPDLHALWNKVYLLVYFNSLKAAGEPADNTWVQIIQKPDTLTPQGKSLLLGVNNWKDTDLNAALAQLGLTLNSLKTISALKRTMQAMELVTTIGYDASLVIDWSTNSPANAQITTIKTTIRQRTDDESWQTTMQSVSDPLRNLRRDALVTYILYHLQPEATVTNADKLYEYFLVDVQMDACMMTSRIRLALSTVQLFIQRCLMNLEANVAASSINPKWWAWMNRYRVWEANRQIFLYPENWLDPELRDDKSAFFTELEGDLLQADITDDLAETAFLHYLKKLDEVARLDIAGMYLDENDQGNPDDDILHVFGRTNGNTRQYYYRNYSYGYWSPWEKISINIEGEQIFPIIWKSRLFVFWLNVITKPDKAEDKTPWDMRTDSWKVSNRKNVEINMAWAEYYKGKWTSPKSSDLNSPIYLNSLTDFQPANILLYARKEKKDANTSEHLIFNLVYTGTDGIFPFNITYTSKNAPPIIEAGKLDDQLLYNVALFNYSLFRTGEPANLDYNHLSVTSTELDTVIQQPQYAAGSTLTEKVLTKTPSLFSGFNLLPLRHPVVNQYQAPFFYNDERSIFFVQPTEKDITPLWKYVGYYDIGLVQVNAAVKIPPLLEKPVAYVPPEEIVKGVGDPIFDPWNTLQNTVNPNFDKILPGTASFAFDKSSFSVGGNAAGFNLGAITGAQTALRTALKINQQ
jgi:hypothetical protein